MVCKVRNKSWAGGIVVARKVEQEKSGGIWKQWYQSFLVFLLLFHVCLFVLVASCSLWDF